ncbi:FAD-dependent oxidoreductase [Burkholderia glumae]|uniref:FAD-dependent oxidoreductase n=1 Tax=Burkholderia glumae TaxID=337 RepID=UPI00054AA11B|nr:FAD-dependent oxidoreductase [Burkholderia glumae]KHJ61961.1 FAD-binding dehydrogenase [Burkholderia glumae]
MKKDPIVECDVLVVGSGAGGLSAAVTAAILGLRVMVVEKEDVFGGTTAWSGGWLWIPRNHLAVRAGIEEDIEVPRTYLRSELGGQFDEARVNAFLEHGPAMLDFFESHSSVRFVDGNAIPDFHVTPGAKTGGRSVCAMPFDGRQLGPLIDKLRQPLSVITLGGMGLMAGRDITHFYRATRSVRSALYVTRRLAQLAWHKLRYGRSMHLVNGNALIARLLKSAIDAGVDLNAGATVIDLITEKQRVAGAHLKIDGAVREVRALRGVVLACGGYPRDIERRKSTFFYTPSGLDHWSAAPRTNTGDGIRLGESVGGRFDDTLHAPAAWVPVSLVPQQNGAEDVVFPHLIDRAKPGVIAVSKAGERFVNEASPYYDFISALLEITPAGEDVHAWLICDHRFQRRYGLGFSKPFPFPIQPHLDSGYLLQAATLDELAVRCGIEPRALVRTIQTYNAHARDGADPQFHRGSTPFNRAQGDSLHAPNPCVAPIERAPFYAVKLLPGSLGTFQGLQTDAQSRVLDGNHRVIPGLYAAGNDSASVMGGFYPSGGITLGPAMTFGYLAGRSLAGERERASRIAENEIEVAR